MSDLHQDRQRAQGAVPPEVIYIRHGERPEEEAHKRSEHPRGVDFHGNQNEHSLLARGCYDVIWTFTRAPSDKYAFAQVPQLLLSSDTNTVI